MEADDAPLVTSWAARAFTLFRDELLELEELTCQEEKTLERDLTQLKAQTTAEATRLLAQSTGPTRPSAGGPSSSSNGASATRRAHKGGKEKGTEASNAAASVRRENMIEARTHELVAQYERQPWRRLYQQYQSELNGLQTSVEPIRARERQEFEFFSMRPAESYTLDDVLDASRHHVDRPLQLVTPPRAESALSASTDSFCASAPQGTTHRPSTAPSGSHLSAMPDDVSGSIIDAVDFARKYNETLTATYGYKPVLGTDLPPPSASHSAWAEDAQKLEAELAQHRPGLDTVPSDFCVKTFPPPGHVAAATAGTAVAGEMSASSRAATRFHEPLPPAPGSAATRRTRLADGTAAADSGRARGKATTTTRDSGPLTLESLRLPLLTALTQGGGRGGASNDANTPATTISSGRNGLGDDDNGNNGDGEVSASSSGRAPPPHKGKGKKGATGRAGAGTRSAAATAADTHAESAEAATTVRDRLAKAPKVECSAKDDTVTLKTVVGEDVRQTIRFTNRAAHKMRFKVKPSSHPWLAYNCTYIAPVPGGGGAPSEEVAVETALSTGGYIEVEVVFNPLDTSEPKMRTTLEVGLAREVNARSGEGAQWDFYNVAVRCETVLPAFKLYRQPTAAEVQAEPAEAVQSVVTRCDFPFTFALAESTMHYQLENTGSTAYVRLVCNSDEFVVDPAPSTSTLLPQGDAMDLSVTFAPLMEGRCRSHLVAEVREAEEGPVLARHTFELRGEGVLPHVRLHRLDDVVVDISGHPQWQTNPEEGPARVTLENTTPDIPKTIRVVVSNDSPVSLPFEWVCEANNSSHDGNNNNNNASGRGDHETEVSIVPAAGTLPANSETVFVASVTAHSVFPLLMSWCLYLTGLPNVSASCPAPPGVQPEVTALYMRPKLVPSARAGSSAPGAGALAVDAYADPVGVFRPNLVSQPTAQLDKVFATGFFAVAHPAVPSAVLVPSCLEEAVDCLLHYENVRRVTLKNHSPRALHFILDPTLEECKGWCAPSSWRFSTRGTEEPDVQISFTPRTGTVPPFGSATITVRFAVHTVGPHHLEVSCFIPEITAYSGHRSAVTMGADAGADVATSSSSVHPAQDAALVEMSADGGGGSSGEGGALVPCSHTVSLHVTGVGASVHTSAEFLDFGLIEEGHEAEASFTVTNDNPIPITFDLLDPMMREPPRFVFIPPVFRLGAGDSVEVTVYRKGVAANDAQTYFELCVRDGATIAIETRATIQSATLMLEDAVLNYGTVPENVWQEQTLHVTNTSALDAPFTVEMAFPLPTPHIDIEFTSQHMVRAGQTRYAVPVRARFRHRAMPSDEEREAGIDRYRSLLAVRSLRTNRALLAEIRCDAVEQLAMSLDVILPSGPNAAPLKQSTSDYLHALLTNEVVERALQIVTDGAAGEAEEEEGMRDNNGEARPPLQAYCPPVVLSATLADDSPVSRESFTLCLTNHTGCESVYHVAAQCFAPLPVDSTQSMRGRPHSLATAASGFLNATTGTAAPPPTVSNAPPTVAIAAHHSAHNTHNNNNNASAVPMMASVQPAFWTTAVNGLEERERDRRVGFSEAQQLLRDGRGCATTLDGTADGPVGPLAAHNLTFSLLANLPGRYEESLQVSCGALPAVAIPVTYEVRGCPILIDPTTSGLTRVEGLDVLVMPSVIASVATSRRAIRVVNRVPRDLNVSVEAFITASTFEVIAVDDDVEASQVVLTLAPLSAATKRREHERKGHTYVSPAHFCLPAMSSKEVIVEYTPSLSLVKGVLDVLDASTITGDAKQRKTKTKRKKSTTGLTAATEALCKAPHYTGSAGSPTDGRAVPSSILTSSAAAVSRGAQSRTDVSNTQLPLPSSSSALTTSGHRAEKGLNAGMSDTSDSDTETSDDDDDRVRPAATQEVDWHGSLVIQAEVADSAFNDAFLIDEFYFLNAAKYPSTRRLRQDGLGTTTTATATTMHKTQTLSSHASQSIGRAALAGTGGGDGSSGSREDGSSGSGARPAWAKSIVRCVPMLDVQRPLRSRPGRVLRQNRLLLPTQAEKFLLDRELHRLGLSSTCASPLAHGPDDTSDARDEKSDSSDDADEDAGVSNVPLLDAASGDIRPVEALLAEQEERLALEAYLERRRAEVREASTRYFAPLELRLRARCGVPRLAVQPSASGVFFPPYSPNTPCVRTIRLTNRNSASLFFQLAVSVPEYFRVTGAELVPSGVEEDPLLAEDEESKLGIKALQDLKWSDTADQKSAAKLLKAGQSSRHATQSRSAIVTLSMQAQSTMANGPYGETLSPLMTVLRGNAAASSSTTHGDSSGVGSNPVYRLRSNDALDVTVEVVNATQFARKAENRHAVLRSTAGGATGLIGMNSTTGTATMLRTGGAATTTTATTAPSLALTATVGSAPAALPPLSLDAILSIQYLQTSRPRPPAVTAATAENTTTSLNKNHRSPKLMPVAPGGAAGSAPQKTTTNTTTSTSAVSGSPRPSSTKRGVRTLASHDIDVPDHVEQTVPLCMHFTAVVVSSSPSLVWFKPGQMRHDGRRQPSYPQRLTLFNHTKQPVTYQLVAVSAQQSFAASSRGAVAGTAADLTPGRKLHEVTNLPDALVGDDGDGALLVDDKTPFVVSPLRGTIPAASRGGEPGVAVMQASFVENSNIRYECAFRVLINGSLSECTFLLRGDSRESEV